MDWRYKTETERALADECVTLWRSICEWQSYALRLRREREALRRELARARLQMRALGIKPV